MIKFRCWYCGHHFAFQEAKIGERVMCDCKNELRIPKRDDGNCRIKTLVDRLIEVIVCGGGGAFLGFGLSVLILSQARRVYPANTPGWMLLFMLGMTAVGFLLGLFGGVRAIDWIGRMIRDREQR